MEQIITLHHLFRENCIFQVYSRLEPPSGPDLALPFQSRSLPDLIRTICNFHLLDDPALKTFKSLPTENNLPKAACLSTAFATAFAVFFFPSPESF